MPKINDSSSSVLAIPVVATGTDHRDIQPSSCSMQCIHTAMDMQIQSYDTYEVSDLILARNIHSNLYRLPSIGDRVHSDSPHLFTARS